MEIFKSKYKDINYFYYQSGSVLFRMFTIYEVDFLSKKFTFIQEKHGQVEIKKEFILNDELLAVLKNKIFLMKYYKLKDNYCNPLVKDGHQWKLIIGYRKSKKTISGSNKRIENFSQLMEIIDLLKKITD